MASINEINTTADCSFDVNNFVDNLLDQEVHFQVLKMKESFFVWIGSAAAKMEGLAVAMTTNIESDPSSASLFGENVDILSTALAKKLVDVTGCKLNNTPDDCTGENAY
ncbi:putative proteasome assembly chaperone 4-like [Apostichopus japonicus]|uniref:Putative proteasome assembly chaperone 4-like n=1 Tax=Stichopus japonicus TaxID=307972 RepID=A0A2G8KCH3_STIJA|nr:putative proteasome assembly chaperone 4-like [Apostichopus japonicus]